MEENQQEQFGEDPDQSENGEDAGPEEASVEPQSVDPKEAQQEGPFDFASFGLPEDFAGGDMDSFCLMGISDQGKETNIAYNPRTDTFTERQIPQQLKVPKIALFLGLELLIYRLPSEKLPFRDWRHQQEDGRGSGQLLLVQPEGGQGPATALHEDGAIRTCVDFSREQAVCVRGQDVWGRHNRNYEQG